MTAWHEYLLELYSTCKFLIALVSVSVGFLIATFGANEDNISLIKNGMLLLCGGISITAILPSRELLARILKWRRTS